MSAKDIAKPSAIVALHAHCRGLQLGAALGLAIATPALLVAPDTANPSGSPPLVVAAHFAGVGAVAGATITTTAVTAIISSSDSAAIHKRADGLMSNKRQCQVDRIGVAGAIVGLTLEGVRIRAVANETGRCPIGLAFSKQGAWEAFGFAVAGAAVSIGISTVVGAVIRSVSSKDDTDEKKELDEGEVTSTEGAVAQNVEETIQAAAAAATEDK